jgi:hypothetical protein
MAAKLCVSDSVLDSEKIKSLYEVLHKNRDTLTKIELNDNVLAHRCEPDIVLPQVRTLVLRLTPAIDADYRTNRIQADWKGLQSFLAMLKVWLGKVRLPGLEVLEIRWRTYTCVNMTTRGILEGYDKHGPLYDTDYDCDMYKLSFDLFVESFKQKPPFAFHWSWITDTYPKFKTLVLPYSMYTFTTVEETYPFDILDEFDEQDEQAFRTTMLSFWSYAGMISY